MGHLHVVLFAALSWNGPTDNVLLDFTASWCGPCQQMSPVVSKLHREGLPIHKVDVDQHPDMARKYGITSIPAFVLIVDGKVVSRTSGKMSEQQLRQLVARIPPARKAASNTELAGSADRLKRIPQDQLSAPKPSRSGTYIARGNNSDAEASAQPDADFLKFAARIHVQDPQGANVGTGTVIDSRPGETLVLTCGHIFRNIDKAGDIEVELFFAGRPQTFRGRYVKHDDAADVGLLSVATPQAVPVARIAPPGYAVTTGEPLVSVGCGGGKDPTVEHIKVTALNRYLGPANLECTGIPQQGRSGGGLFTTTGLVVGVCTAADPRDKKGLYCALKPIHAILEKCQLSRLYAPGPKQMPALPPEGQVASRELPAELASESLVSDGHDDLIPAEFQASLEDLNEVPANRAAARQMLAGAEDAEIVCVIRPIGQPQAASRVVVIHRATQEFVRNLTGELENQPELNRTTLHRPKSGSPDAVKAQANAPRSLPELRPIVDETPRPFRLPKSRSR